MRRQVLAAAVSLLMSACALVGDPVTGEHVDVFLTPSVGNAFIGLNPEGFTIAEYRGAAVVIAPGIAVTNAHNAKSLAQAGIADIDILGRSPTYDLLFFRTARGTPLAHGNVFLGENVVAYGNVGDLRVVKGAVKWWVQEDAPLCSDCPLRYAFTYGAPGGHGFSGGPVVDAQNGLLVGITFGFRDGMEGADGRMMYAYDMNVVMQELARVQGRRPGQ
ncbi:MAG: hypothetical protein GC166_08035 [Alphaproteobacteria bacterium]|nr:hypothetical protein [Alphaproteobacteria bacterium]